MPQETLDAILPNFIDSASVNGKLAYLPIYSDPVSLKCNKALIESVGGTFPEDGVWSFEEFDAVAEKLAAAGKAAAVFRLADEQGDYDWLGYIWGHGMREFDDAGKSAMGSPEGISGIQWMADANKKGWVLPGTSTISFADVDTAYYSGKLACMGGNMRHLLRANEAKEAGSLTEPFDGQLAMYPHADGLQPYGVSTFDAGYLVFSQEDAAKKQAIADFLAFATQLPYVTAEAKTGSISPFKAVGNALEADPVVGPEAAKYVDWIGKYGVLPSFQSLPQYNDIRLLRVPIMQSAVLGKTSPADASRADRLGGERPDRPVIR